MSTSGTADGIESTQVFPLLTRADVLACVFSSWYPTFRRVSPKASVVKPLSQAFVSYLESDRVFLPEGSGPMGISEMNDSDDEEDDSGNDSDDESWQVSFPELDAEIRRIISRYDGAVFPKLNWSSPQDASWMIPGGALKCQHPADVYLLLKSSDFINHDLDYAFDGCVDEVIEGEGESVENDLVSRVDGISVEDGYSEDEEKSNRVSRRRGHEFELVLKKWFDMPPSQEWRCFVRDKRLIGISQRDTNFYDFLQPLEAQLDIQDQVASFFEDEIQNNFPTSSYIFDIYLTRTASKIFIIDFNVYAPRTSSLLFTYSELASLALSTSTNDDLPILRIINSPSQSASSMPPFSHNRYPKDVVDLSDGSSIAEFAKEWSKVLEKGVKDTLTD